MTAFAYEIAAVLAAQEQARPGDPQGAYALPWYLVVGDPGTGRSSAVRAVNLSWPYVDGPLQLGTPTQMCTYWMPEKAVFIEPENQVMGLGRSPGLLRDLCAELMERRPREPVDGLILVINATQVADADEAEIAAVAKNLRRYLVEVGQHLGVDVPVYVMLTALDGLWGFGDAFEWTAERQNEEPWGFTLPVSAPDADNRERILTGIEGLRARIESVCLDTLSGEQLPERRARAFQHLAEVRTLLQKVAELLSAITMDNAFERTPWLRALVVGSAIPGTGDRLRSRAAEHAQMGLQPPPQSGSARNGGMPMHALLERVLLPERDMVPLRSRWRDDRLFLALLVVGILLWLAAIVLTVVFLLL